MATRKPPKKVAAKRGRPAKKVNAKAGDTVSVSKPWREVLSSESGPLLSHDEVKELTREQFPNPTRDQMMALKHDLDKATEQTLGDKRVRVGFNPSLYSTVDQIKVKTAELIDLLETLRNKDERLVAEAQTRYEDAAMWAVKAATA